MERVLKVCDKARIKQFNQKADFSEEGKAHRARAMPRLVGHIVLVVDYSDGHGLCYRVIAPNFNGHRGRENELEIVWVDPSELEYVDPNDNSH